MKKNVLHELLMFLRHPKPEAEKVSSRIKTARMLLLLSWTFIVVFSLGILLAWLTSAIGFQGTNLVESLVDEENVIITIILAAVIAPAIEEVVFRLPLIQTARNLAIALAALSVIVAARIQQLVPLLLLTAAIPLLAHLYIQLLSKQTVHYAVSTIYARHYGKIFYTLAILFGSVHMLNYTNVQSGIAILPLLIIPQTVVGVMLGFIRIKYGFTYAVVFHGLYNGLLIVPALLATRSSENITLLATVGFTYLLILVIGLKILISQALEIKNKNQYY